MPLTHHHPKFRRSLTQLIVFSLTVFVYVLLFHIRITT
jgi:hypothetical protein